LMRAIDRRFCHLASALGEKVCNVKPSPKDDPAVEAEKLLPASSKILKLAKSGVTGTQSAFNTDILNGAAPDVVCNQMRSDRATWGAIIERRLAATIGTPSADGAQPYANMYEAANDLLAYDRAGSWTDALASLRTQSAAKAQACGNRRKAMLTGVGSAGQGAADNSGC
jgi:hypothetical protein